MNETASKHPAALCPIPRTGLRGSSGIILYLLLTLASATIGIGICTYFGVSELWQLIAEGVSGVALVLFIIHLWRISRHVKGLRPIILVLAILLVLAAESLIPAAILMSLIFAVGEGSVLLAIAPGKQAVWFPLVPLVAFGIALLFGQNLVGAAASLLPFPAMLILAIATRNSAAREDGLTRVGVICATSAAFGATLLALAALGLFRALGSLTPETLTAFLESLRTAAIEAIVGMEVPEELSEFTSRENAELLVNSVVNLLPGYAVVLINLLSVVAQFVQHAGLVSFGFGESITDRVRVFRMSLMSCLVFTIAYFMVIFSNAEASTLPATVAQNIYLVLLPGLSFAGMLRLFSIMTRRGPGGMGCLFYFIILVPILFVVAPVILAIVEVVGHIVSLISSRLKPPSDNDSAPTDRE